MNNYDADPQTKKCAKLLIESLNGKTVQAAERIFTLLELGVSHQNRHHPGDIADFFRIIQDLPLGPAFNAVRLARQVIMERTAVNTDSAETVAQMLVESMRGRSIQAAERILNLLELGLVNKSSNHPSDVAEFFQIIKGLPTGFSLGIVRFARQIIMERTAINANSAETVAVFTTWQHEAALSGVAR